MRKKTRDLLLLVASIALVGLLAIAARSQVERPAPPEGYRTWTAKDAPLTRAKSATENRPARRPLDDSDPEMKALAQEFFAQGPCGRGPGGRCPEAKAPLKVGGERLAGYLIRQYQESLVAGYPDTATILTAIAGTESRMGTLYIQALIEAPQDHREKSFALSALQECASSRAVDVALRVLETAPTTDAADRAAAIRAIEVNIQEGKLDRPDAVTRLQSFVEADAPGLDRLAAERALRSLSK